MGEIVKSLRQPALLAICILGAPSTLNHSVAAAVDISACDETPGTCDPKPVASKYIAKLTAWHKVEWRDGTRPSKFDPRIASGTRLVLGSGVIEITYDTGVVVVIEGPAEFYVGGAGVKKVLPGDAKTEGRALRGDAANNGFLKLGKLAARVKGKNAAGFSIDIPFGYVEDLGTELGIEVKESGATELVVLQGEVDLVRVESRNNMTAERVRLVKGDGASISAKGKPLTRLRKLDAKAKAQFQKMLEREDSPER